MDKMKKQIERRVRIMWAGFFVLTLLSAYDDIGPGLPVTSHVSEYILEFQHGLRFGGMMVLLFVILRYIWAMRDEQKFKKLYYSMTDVCYVLVNCSCFKQGYLERPINREYG